MTEWGVFGVIVALVGLLATVTAPLIKLNSNITHLNVTLDQMRQDVDAQKAAAKESHRRLWEHNEEQDEKLENHECRIKILEIKKQEEQK